MMASKSNEDAMVLKVNDGNYIHIEGYRKERVGETYVKLWTVYFSQYMVGT